MKFIEAIITALSILRANKIRTALTMLGIVIGIAGVIGMMSFSAGAQQLLMWEVEKVGGPSMFGVYRNSRIRKGSRWVRNPSKHFLTMDDLRAIQAECPSVEVATPDIRIRTTLSVSEKHKQAQLQATTYEFQLARKWYSNYGRFISDDDLGLWSKVCVIGEEVWKDLFAGLDPIGRELKINQQRFTVIGIMESRGKGLDPVNSEDNQVIIPITAAQTHIWGHDHVGHILMRAKDHNSVDEAVREVETVLRRNNGGETFFETWVMKEELKSANQILFIIEMILVVIASVSLVVGGIGIMNIMLVSVTERIPEIGLRKAVGAKNKDIRLQFLTESVVLCVISSLIGLAFGVLIGHGFSWVVTKLLFKGFDWPSVVRLQSVLAAVVSGITIGIVFGIYPAFRAAKLTPIEALRHT